MDAVDAADTVAESGDQITSHVRSSDFEAGMTDTDLFNFTKAMHQKLPRELRDIIYTHLLAVLDPSESSAMDATLDPRPLGWIHSPRPTQLQSKWPRAIDPSVVPRAFASELVEAFYEQYQGLAIQDARTFESVLHMDFFNLDVRVSDKALSALTVCIQLRSRYGRAYTHDSNIAMNAALTLSHDCKYVQTNDITDCFEPLLQEKQRLANGFKLDIFLHT